MLSQPSLILTFLMCLLPVMWSVNVRSDVSTTEHSLHSFLENILQTRLCKTHHSTCNMRRTHCGPYTNKFAWSVQRPYSHVTHTSYICSMSQLSSIIWLYIGVWMTKRQHLCSASRLCGQVFVELTFSKVQGSKSMSPDMLVKQ